MDIKDLLEKGDGTLVRTNGVWSYPGAPLDPSGTNLRLPIDHVSDAEVQAALGDESLVVAVTNPDGTALAVRVKGDGAHRVLTTAQAGTAEAVTELPVGSHPSVDAGAGSGSVGAEGAEKQGKEGKASSKEPTSETDARKGR
ncbi:hypothetical protein [Bosea sp. BK604]|uniref:hypothetical protein n=1 Tax=Bosea sp. BK604 TaxID=2512180 RepID=UPI00104AD17D|nr:hypothetical protein [Bosea sp. BK604]TCR60950.1 hypothetical protein EV560_115175 [Bosea sp. BK604]